MIGGRALVPQASGQTTMAVTLPAPPERVWPWLVRTGGDRVLASSDGRPWFVDRGEMT